MKGFHTREHIWRIEDLAIDSGDGTKSDISPPLLNPLSIPEFLADPKLLTSEAQRGSYYSSNRLATKWLRILSLSDIEKIRNHLVANTISAVCAKIIVSHTIANVIKRGRTTTDWAHKGIFSSRHDLISNLRSSKRCCTLQVTEVNWCRFFEVEQGDY